MAKLHIFTSAACNYIPKVRMLFNSLRQYHPEAVLHLILADARTPLLDLSQEPFDEVMTVEELDIPHWRGWAFCHSIVELATAIKPFYLKRLLEREDCARVLYLDPDMVVFSRLDDILLSLDTANILLTPHQIEPEATLAAIIDNEICSLKHGVYNLGFIGVANQPEGRRFAAWWASRVYHFCRSEIHNGLFTDQRWIDLAPAFFDGVAISRSSRHNVATWNLTTREFSRTAEGDYLVDGDPLGFYHFTGFDSGAHRIMANRNANGNAAVLSLIGWYEDNTKDLGKDPLSQVPWHFGTYSDGKPVEKADRLIYRNRVDLQRAFSDPFHGGEKDSYDTWLQHQGRREYPGLFDSKRFEAAYADMTRQLTPGFSAHLEGVQTARNSISSLMKQSLRNPEFGMNLIKRGITVLRREGYRGVIRKLKR